VVTGSLSLVTAALTHRWSEQARLRADREQETRATRDQKREACHNYLVATNLFYQAVDQVYLRASRNEQFDQREHVRAAITALQDAYVYLTISSGADVRKLARDYNMVLYELEKAAQRADHDKWSELERETHRARRHLREAMRVELGVQDLAVRYTSDIVAAIGRCAWSSLADTGPDVLVDPLDVNEWQEGQCGSFWQVRAPMVVTGGHGRSVRCCRSLLPPDDA